MYNIDPRLLSNSYRGDINFYSYTGDINQENINQENNLEENNSNMIDDDLYGISDDEYNNAIQVNNIQYSVIIEKK